MRVAVVGAGLAGLTAARILVDQGRDVVVVDKGRHPGGRMSTRRTVHGCFDHGAQYFTARDERFLRHVANWRKRGLVDIWDARIAVVNEQQIAEESGTTERYVAVPGMNALCEEMAAQLPQCRLSWHVNRIGYEDGQWTLRSTEGERLVADTLLLTVPPPQAMALVRDNEAAQLLANIEMQPCWALMAVFDRPLLRDHDAAFVNHGPLSWLARQASRPGRAEVEAWVLHATPEWSAEHLEDCREKIRTQLIRAALDISIAQPVQVEFAVAHRWRYALARKPIEKGVVWFQDQRMAIAGDWCHGSRVEGAFLSGAAAAARILASESGLNVSTSSIMDVM